jgi:hypothetical protein
MRLQQQLLLPHNGQCAECQCRLYSLPGIKLDHRNGVKSRDSVFLPSRHLFVNRHGSGHKWMHKLSKREVLCGSGHELHGLSGQQLLCSGVNDVPGECELLRYGFWLDAGLDCLSGQQLLCSGVNDVPRQCQLLRYGYWLDADRDCLSGQQLLCGGVDLRRSVLLQCGLLYSGQQCKHHVLRAGQRVYQYPWSPWCGLPLCQPRQLSRWQIRHMCDDVGRSRRCR